MPLVAAILLAAQIQTSVVTRMKEEAAAIRPLIKTKLANEWLDGVEKLPEPAAKIVYRTADKKLVTEAEYKALPEKEKTDAKKTELPPSFFYYTKYGTPLAYVRIIELAAENGLTSLEGKSLVDYGYGGVGHLRLTAQLGAKTVGIDVDPLLVTLYSDPADTGAFGKGSVQLVNGFWPGGEGMTAKVGDGFDLFVSKNTLKRGYVHPERKADPSKLIDLGVTDEAYLQAVWKALKPGGLFIVYNLSPAQNPPEKEFIPWADGRFPFERSLAEKVGFKVLAFDEDDNKFARAMGAAYGWGKPEELEKSIFGHYSILKKA